MALRAEETHIVGKWVSVGGTVEEDDSAKRIQWLVTSYLQQLAVSSSEGAWATLFQDPGDGRLWERYFPHSDLHGGGPPALRVISEAAARLRYQF